MLQELPNKIQMVFGLMVFLKIPMVFIGKWVTIPWGGVDHRCPTPRPHIYIYIYTYAPPAYA